MGDDNVIKFGKDDSSVHTWTVEDMLRDTLEQIKPGGRLEGVECAYLVMRKKGEDESHVHSRIVRMSYPQIIGVLAMQQVRLTIDMDEG